MAIPKWALKQLQKEIDAGNIDHGNLSETARSQLTPLETPSYSEESNTQGMADFRQAERDTPMPELTEPAGGQNYSIPEEALRLFNIASDAAQKGATLGLGGEGGPIDRLAQTIVNPLAKYMGKTEVVPDIIPEPTNSIERGARVFGDLMGATVPITPISKIAELIPYAKGASTLGGKILQGAIRGGAAGSIYEGAKAGIEGESLPDIAKDAGIGALQWGGIEAGLPIVGAAIKSGLGRLGKTKIEEPADPGEIFANIQQEPTTNLLGDMQSQYSGLKAPRTQAEKALPPNMMLDQMRNTLNGVSNTPKGSVPQVLPMRRPVDMASLPDKYSLPDVSNLEGKALVNRAKQEPPALPGSTPLALPEPNRPNWEYGTGQIDPRYQLGQLAKMQKETVNKTLADRLSAVEQTARANIDRAKSGSMGITPTPDLITSYAVLGAAKMAKKGIQYAEWAKAMLDDLGEDVRAYLPYLWHRAKEISSSGATTLKIDGKEYPVDIKSMPGSDWNHVATKTTGPSTTIKGAANKLYEATFDDLNRLNQVDREAYVQALNSRESGGVAKNIVENGLVDSQGNQIGPSLKSITKQIPKKAVSDFDNYLIYRHAPSWLEQGRKVFPDGENITADVARQRAAAYEQNHPEFKRIADQLIKWQRDMGKAWLVDTGIVKPEAWAQMEQMYPDYVPFQRKMQDIETAPGQGKARRGFANQGNPLKKGEGSQREIISPIETIIEHVDKYVKTAKRNEVMQTLYGKVQSDPEAYKGLIEVMPEKGETFESVFAKDGMDGFINWMEEPFNKMQARKNVEYDKPNIVRGIINGETAHFKVDDPALLESLTALSPQGQNAVIEFFRQGTRIMKVLTTGGNPIFATRNIARDLPMAYISSDTLTKTPIAREVQFAWGVLDSFARILTGGRYDPGSYYKAYKAMGGGSHSSSMAADRNLLAESKASVLPGYYDIKKPVASLGRLAKAGGRGIEQFTNAVETAPRLPEYIRTAKQGGDTYASRQQGLFNAQDVTVNFSRHGTVSKDVDAFVPYLNAALQGIDKLGRVYSKNPIQAVYRSVVAVTVPAIGLWMINRDDPNYQKLSGWTRDNYFCIPMTNGKFLKIAKPREAGVVFGSLVERALNKWANDDPNGFKGFSEAWINSFAPPARTIAAPLTDVMANKNFAGATIVPGYMQRLSPEQQFDESTSAPAKALGKLTGSSPKKIDYLARSYTGVLGELGIPAAAEGRGESAGQRVKNVLGKTFTADPLYSNDTMSNFYELKDKLDTANSDFKATKTKSADYNPNKARVMNSAADKIGEINKQIRAINGNKTMSYEAKDARVRTLKQRALNIADQTMKRVEGIK